MQGRPADLIGISAELKSPSFKYWSLINSQYSSRMQLILEVQQNTANPNF